MTSAEIVRELRASRPAAPHVLRARVEAIAASTPPAPRPSLAGRLLPRRRALLVAVPVAAALAVASAGVIGVVAPSDPADQSLAVRNAAAPESSADQTYKVGAEAAGGAGTALDSSTATTPGPTTGRAQRVTASLTIEVADTDALSKATQQALQTTRSLGGYVVSVSYATGTDGSLVVDGARAHVAGAGRHHAALVARHDRRPAGADRRPAGVDRHARQAHRRPAGAHRPPHGADRGPERRRADPGDPDGPARRRPRRARHAAARPRRSDGGSAHGDHPAHARHRSRGRRAGDTVRFDRALDQAVEILAWEAAIVLFALILVGPFVLIGLAVWWGRRTLGRRTDDRLLEASP